jgi:Na+-transporting NADH:ubiquinone oxidoreductase subunit NqrB
MHLVPDFEETPSETPKKRRPIRWAVILIASILILANLRVVLVTVAIVAFVFLLFGFIVVVALIRKVTRPIGQLSLLDVALVTWAYRRWEIAMASHRIRRGSVIGR